MTVFYGQHGQPVASIEGDAVFLKDGTHSAQLLDGYLYKVDDGEWIGSLVSGIIFNSFGAPQGFSADCKEVLAPPMPPRLKATLPIRLKSVGRDISNQPSISPPAFLRTWLESTAPTAWRDGYFR